MCTYPEGNEFSDKMIPMLQTYRDDMARYFKQIQELVLAKDEDINKYDEWIRLIEERSEWLNEKKGAISKMGADGMGAKIQKKTKAKEEQNARALAK